MPSTISIAGRAARRSDVPRVSGPGSTIAQPIRSPAVQATAMQLSSSRPCGSTSRSSSVERAVLDREPEQRADEAAVEDRHRRAAEPEQDAAGDHQERDLDVVRVDLARERRLFAGRQVAGAAAGRRPRPGTRPGRCRAPPPGRRPPTRPRAPSARTAARARGPARAGARARGASSPSPGTRGSSGAAARSRTRSGGRRRPAARACGSPDRPGTGGGRARGRRRRRGSAGRAAAARRRRAAGAGCRRCARAQRARPSPRPARA